MNEDAIDGMVEILDAEVSQFQATVAMKIRNFHSYFVNFWLPIKNYWNHHNSIAQRTTNSVKGWHSKLNKKFSKAHPKVWRLLEVLKLECSETDKKLLGLASGQRLKNQQLNI